jgi:hypothetical protein
MANDHRQTYEYGACQASRMGKGMTSKIYSRWLGTCFPPLHRSSAIFLTFEVISNANNANFRTTDAKV